MKVKQFLKETEKYNNSIIEKEIINILEDYADPEEDINNIDINDLIQENGAFPELIYYRDCWNFLQEEDITNFEEAIAIGYKDITSIATYYLNAYIEDAFKLLKEYILSKHLINVERFKNPDHKK